MAAIGCADQEPAALETSTLVQLRQVETTPVYLFVLTEERAPLNDLLMAVERLGGEIQNRHDAIGVFSVHGITEEDAAELAQRPDVQGVNQDTRVQWLPPDDDLDFEAVEGPSDQTDQSDAGFYAAGRQWNISGRLDVFDSVSLHPCGGGSVTE